MAKTRPNPESDYLSKYLVDFNKRELDKFFHPEKFPKIVLSAAFLGIVVFLSIAWIFPLKNQLLDTQYQKEPASASQQKEQQNLTISGPLSAKTGEMIKLIVSLRSDLKEVNQLNLEISYPSADVTFISAKPLSVGLAETEVINSKSENLKLNYKFAEGLKTNGINQEILVVVFQLNKTGRFNFFFTDQTTIFDLSQSPIEMTKNNFSILSIN